MVEGLASGLADVRPRERVRGIARRELAIDGRVDGGAVVVVDAPDAATPAGSELWNWYGDADEPREREAFIENFGFDPG